MKGFRLPLFKISLSLILTHELLMEDNQSVTMIAHSGWGLEVGGGTEAEGDWSSETSGGDDGAVPPKGARQPTGSSAGKYLLDCKMDTITFSFSKEFIPKN